MRELQSCSLPPARLGPDSASGDLLRDVAVCLPRINWVRHFVKPLVPLDNALTPGQLPGPQIGQDMSVVRADHRLAVSHVLGKVSNADAVL